MPFINSQTMTLISQLIEIIFRKRAPEDIDHNVTNALLLFTFSATAGYVMNATVEQYTQPLLYSLVFSLTHALAIYAVLQFFKKDGRYVQTMTALLGVSLILQAVMLITSQIVPLPLITVVVTAWNFYLIVIILRSALECSVAASVLLTLGYHLFMVGIMVVLLPDWSKEFMQVVEQAQQLPE